MAAHPTTLLALCTAALIATAASPSFGQSEPRSGPNPHFSNPPARSNPHWVEPPARLPRLSRGDRARNLDFLFGALKAAPDEVSAKHVEERIWALWLVSTSDTANLLMTRVKRAVEAEKLDLAIRLLDSIIEIRPQFVEAWNRRATVFFLRKDYANALADLRQVLAREPRHFGALAGLGMILQDMGDDKDALEAYRRALAVHPHLNGVAEKVKTLSEKVEGREI
jgi:tetratricopeptide (TPR) repeat protein